MNGPVPASKMRLGWPLTKRALSVPVTSWNPASPEPVSVMSLKGVGDGVGAAEPAGAGEAAGAFEGAGEGTPEAIGAGEALGVCASAVAPMHAGSVTASAAMTRKLGFGKAPPLELKAPRSVGSLRYRPNHA